MNFLASGADRASMFRRMAAGAVGGFVACLSIIWVERVVHLLGPLDNMGVAILDGSMAAGWALLCVLLFASVRRAKGRLAVFAFSAWPFLGYVVFMNPQTRQGPGALGILLPTLIFVLTVGVASAILGNCLEGLWSQHEGS